jgi:hypothetical protein
MVGNLVVGVLKASPSAVGVGNLAETQRSAAMAGNDIRMVTFVARPRVITISSSWRPVVRLHCPNREPCAEVREFLEARVPEGGGSPTRT